jgi:hypothetical protein
MQLERMSHLFANLKTFNTWPDKIKDYTLINRGFDVRSRFLVYVAAEIRRLSTPMGHVGMIQPMSMN